MPLRIYICPMIGAGQHPNTTQPWTDATGPWRSLMVNFLNPSLGDSGEGIDHPGHNIVITLVDASASTLTTIEADIRVTPVIPLRATDRTHLAQILATPFSSYPLAWRNAARAKLEGWGINTEWITASHTMKDVLRQVIKLFSIAQVMDGAGQTEVINFIKNNLDSTVGSLSAAQRNAASSWLTSRGVDTSWITGTTTVRQVVHYISDKFPVIYGRNVGHRFAGEDF
jgi:hypothetical protein